MKFKLFFFLPILFYSCNLKETKSDYQPESFTFFVAQKSNVSVYEEYPSTIEGQIDLEIRASVEGYIMNVLINEGQFVKAGKSYLKLIPDHSMKTLKMHPLIYLLPNLKGSRHN